MEKPSSAAIDRASDIPPMRFTGFLPTQLDSLAIDISNSNTHNSDFLIKIPPGFITGDSSHK